MTHVGPGKGPPPTRAVLFDLDDTLFDHSVCTREALLVLQASCAAYAAWSFEEFERRHAHLLEILHVEVLAGRMSVDDARLERFGRLAAEAGRPVSPDTAIRIAGEYREAYVAAWRPVPGARELLAALRGPVRVGIVTNNVATEQRQKIDACGFSSLLDAVVISEDVGVAKPDPRIFAECLKRLDADAGQTVMVGDSWPSDIAGARAAGLRSVWFNRFGAPVPDGSVVAQLASLEPARVAAEVVLSAEHHERERSVWERGTP